MTADWITKAQDFLLGDEPLPASAASRMMQPLAAPRPLRNGNTLRMDLEVAMRRALIQWHDAHPGKQAPPALIPNWTAFDKLLVAQDLDAAAAYITTYSAHSAEA